MDSGYWTRIEQEQYSRRMEDEHHRVNKRIGILEKNYEQLTELTMCVREQTMTLDNMAKEVKRQGDQISAVINAPAKRWDRAKDKAIEVLVGLIVGGLAGIIITALATTV